MGLVSTLLRPPVQASGDPNDERFWTHGFGNIASSGVVVNADTAMRTSAVYACVRLISESVAMLPLQIYERVGDSGRRRAPNHPLYDVLRYQPNSWQTAMEFREMLTGHCLLRGNGYAQIIPGPRGAVDQLVPLHPDLVTPEKIPGGLRYKLQQDDLTTKILTQDEVFHLKGLSSDGVRGLAVLENARESFGLAISTEQYGARLFAQNARPGGVLQSAAPLSEANQKRLKEEWEQGHAGLVNAHRIAILPQGLTWQQIGMTNEDAQFLATREFQIEDISRWFGVPLHMISSHTKATSWGSGIEQLSIGFVTYTLMAWLVRWEQTIARDLIIAPDRYFAEFLVDMLLRGSTQERYNSYSIAVGGNAPWMTRNEVRERENMSPIDGLDDILQPLNMSIPKVKPATGEPRLDTPSVDQPSDPSNPNGPRPDTPAKPDGTGAYLRLLVYQAAGRVVRKEAAAMRRLERVRGENPIEWKAGVDAFYADHPRYVSETMQVPLVLAERYAESQRDLMLAEGEGADALDDPSEIEKLAQLALGD